MYDSKTGLIFVSTREGWVHIFHEDSPDHYSEAGKVKTELGAKTMAYDPKTKRIFVDTAEFGKAPEPKNTRIRGRRRYRVRFMCWCTRRTRRRSGSSYRKHQRRIPYPTHRTDVIAFRRDDLGEGDS